LDPSLALGRLPQLLSEVVLVGEFVPVDLNLFLAHLLVLLDELLLHLEDLGPVEQEQLILLLEELLHRPLYLFRQEVGGFESPGADGLEFALGAVVLRSLGLGSLGLGGAGCAQALAEAEVGLEIGVALQLPNV